VLRCARLGDVIDLVRTLDEAWSALAELAATLTEDEWATATGCPGWTVHDVVAHVVDLDGKLAAGARPEITDTESGVAARRSASTDALLAEYAAVTARRLEQLASLTEADLDGPAITPIGEARMRDALAMRVMDVWAHEQDIRRAVGRPGHERGPVVEHSVAYLATFLGFVVGRRAGAPDGTTVVFDIDAYRIAVEVKDRRGNLVEPPAAATVELALDAPTFVALAGGRSDAPRDAVRIIGDRALGERVVETLGFLP
jgi:uncharacterized protein (TIGR03083 family)